MVRDELGRRRLMQWDINQRLIVDVPAGTQIHYASEAIGDKALVTIAYEENGLIYSNIPNIILQSPGTITVYVYPIKGEEAHTKSCATIVVLPRAKPEDYVYTETEVLDWRTLDEKIGDLAKLTTTAKENLVAAINEAATKGMASIYMRVAEGYIEYSGDGVSWKQLIAVAELKGEKGEKGDPGSDATVDIVTPTAESTDTQAASAKAVWDISGDLSTLKTTAKNNLVNALNEVHDSIGSGGSGGTDISLGVTGAVVGDIIKVKSADADGKPTAWEAAELGMRLIRAITLAEQTDRVDITTDENGNTFSLNEVYCSVNAQSYTDNNERYYFLPNGGWGIRDPYITSSNTSTKLSDSWKNQMNFHCVYASGYIMAEQLPTSGSNNSLSSRVEGNMSPITKISVAGKIAVGCTIVVWGAAII